MARGHRLTGILLLLLLPTALAQLPIPIPTGPGSADVNITMELQDPGLPLVPERPYALTLTIHYQFGPGGAVSPDPEIAPFGRTCGQVKVLSAPIWANVTITPSTVCFTINPTNSVSGTTVDNTTIVEVNVTGHAPALQPANLTVSITVPHAGTLQEGAGETSRTISPNFVGKLLVAQPATISLRGGVMEQVPIRVRNDGNGPIEVRFRNATSPQGMRVELPERFVLQAPGDERVAFVALRSSWTAPVKGQVEMQIEATHPTRPDLQGDAVRARFDVQSLTAIPALETIPLALAAAALALANRAVFGNRLRRGPRLPR